MKFAESAGVILFDREAGHAVESQSDMRITGDINFEAQGMPLPSKLDLKMHRGMILRK